MDQGHPKVAGLRSKYDSVALMASQVPPTAGPKDFASEAILLQGQPGKPAPTLVFPHGGPHSAYPDGFWPAAGFLCALGFNIILVNFRCWPTISSSSPLHKSPGTDRAHMNSSI